MTTFHVQYDNGGLLALGSLRAEGRESAVAAKPVGWWLASLSALLAGYALLGKGFAYVGAPPLYAGEIVLLLGLISAVATTQWHRLLYLPYTWLIFAFCGWGALQTVPYLSRYQVDALRDAALCGYSVFALIVFAHLITRPERLANLLYLSSRFTLPLVILAPLNWFSGRMFEASLPNWPWAPVQILGIKGGDLLVHLSGVLAFWIAYPDQRYSQRTRFLGLLVISGAVLAVGSENRGGLVAFLLTYTICLIAYPKNRALWSLVLAGICATLILAVTDLQIPLGDRDRTISFDQVVRNVETITGGSKADAGDVTKTWRLDWWNEIISYTLEGKYFWTGKGFGVNLADDDGFQVGDEEDGSAIRSPHNAHMTLLARTGVPGLIIWFTVLAAWIGRVAVSYLQARIRGEQRWAGLFLFLLVYWLAMLVTASFDIYLEGPVGGIWFWTICGVGLAAVWLHQRQPELLKWDPVGEVHG